MASREWTDKAPARGHGPRGGRHRAEPLGLTDLSAGDLRLLLNGEWEFAEGPDGSPPAAGWGRVRVPHRSREFEDEPPASGWYRTTLEVPADWETGDRRLVLDPGRVRHFGRLYLDGGSIGEHRGMRLPWRLDLTSLVDSGSVHDLLLFTHNCTGPYAHPRETSLSEDALKALDTRFWRTSAATVGLESDIRLSLESRVRIEDVHVTTSVREGAVTAALTVRNGGDSAFVGQVRLRVRRGGGTMLELPGCGRRGGAGGGSARERVSLVEGSRDLGPAALRRARPLLPGDGPARGRPRAGGGTRRARRGDPLRLPRDLGRGRPAAAQRHPAHALGRPHRAVRVRAPVADAEVHRPGRRQRQHRRAPPLRPALRVLRRGRRAGGLRGGRQLLRRYGTGLPPGHGPRGEDAGHGTPPGRGRPLDPLGAQPPLHPVLGHHGCPRSPPTACPCCAR